MIFYKATRPDGTSFHDQKTTWTVGETVSVAESDRQVKLCGGGVLHASDAPGETLLGGSWPCRLFEVEGEPSAHQDHKYGFHELTVIRELPAWQALGPNGEVVEAHIEKCKTVTPEQVDRLNAAVDAAWGAVWNAARDAAWDAVWNAARDAAVDAAWDAVWNAARTAARDAAGNSALALLVRDLITPEQFDVLYGPWASVMEVDE